MLKRMSLRATWIALACAISFSVHAMADTAREITIPAGDLRQGLLQLSKEYGVELVYEPALLAHYRTAGVKGNYTAPDAVRLLLKGTPLELRTDPSGAMLIAPPRAHTTSTEGQAQPAPISGRPTGDSLQLGQTTPGQDQGNASVEKSSGKSDQESELKEVQPNIPEILIKGSKIMNVDVKRSEDDVQPYTILTSQQIEQSGARNVEDFLKQQLTMNTTAQTNTQALPGSPGGATTSINLRGLGSNETLILIDGRRSAGISLYNATGALNQPDIGGIPLSAIERIEVLPSSASAIYGGAAVGGVVNIILKRNFSGGDVSYSYDRASSSDADRQTVNGTFGTSLWEGRTQLMVAGSYSSGNPLLVQDREEIIRRGISTILTNSPGYLYNPFAPFPGATTNIVSADGSNLVLKNGTPLNSPITFVPPGAAPGTDLSSGLLADAGRYNLSQSAGTGTYGLQSPIGTVPTVKSLLGTVRQTLFNDVQLFAELSTTSNSTNAIQNPFNAPYPVPSTSPADPFQQNVTVNVPSAAAFRVESDSVTQSSTVGAKMPISHGWGTEIDYTWSRSLFNTLFYSVDPAIYAAFSDGTLNPFVDSLAHPLSLAQFAAPQTYSGGSTLGDLSLRAAGTVGSLPAGNPTLTIGLEHRREASETATLYQSYPISSASDIELRVFGQPQSTDSIYAEAQVPLVGSQNAIPGINSLDLQLAGRTERYDVSTGTLYQTIIPAFLQAFDPPQGVRQTNRYTSTNPTIGFKYRPVHSLTLRASYSSAFLPPSAGEFLANPTPVFGAPVLQIFDPATGRTYGIDETAGGNPSLKPQTSKDWDVGLVWEPQDSLLDGLRTDVEFYKITQPNYITRPTAQQVISDPSLQSRVTRDPTTGLITLVDTSFLNATEYRTSGFDLRLDYTKQMALGNLSFRAASTIIKFDQRQYGLGTQFLEYAGYPNDGGEGKIKANATLSWNYRKWTVAWMTTYYSSYKQEYSPGSPSYIQAGGGGGLTAIASAQGASGIPAQSYHDVYVSYGTGALGRAGDATASMLSNISVDVGITNVFNTLPPFDAAFVPYYYSSYGDAWLRTFRVSVKKSF